jgi:mannitol-1-/sugar-/sorbitol-6-phosphatase
VRPTGLLLDLDGTLVDSEPLQRVAYRSFFRARGWDAPDLSLFTGRRAADVFATEPGPWSGQDPAVLTAEVLALVPREEPPAAVPGARELLLAAVGRGVPVAIVTSAQLPWVVLAVGDGLGLLDHVDLVVTADDVVDGKPDPSGFLLACSRLGIEAGGAVAVEDSPAGVQAARAAGVGHVVGITTSRTHAELTAAGAHAAYDDLRPLADVLLRGSARGPRRRRGGRESRARRG